MDYEFTLVFNLDMRHKAVASKDRTSLFMDKPSLRLCRMYNHLLYRLKNEITLLLLTDTQLGAVVKDY